MILPGRRKTSLIIGILNALYLVGMWALALVAAVAITFVIAALLALLDGAW